MADLSVRSKLPEKMDQSGVPEQEIQQALRELENVNTFLGGYGVVLHALEQIKWPRKSVKIMDLGCGGGDMLRAIAKWADKKSRRVELVGVDWNPVMTAYAANKSDEYNNITYQTISIFE